MKNNNNEKIVYLEILPYLLLIMGATVWEKFLSQQAVKLKQNFTPSKSREPLVSCDYLFKE
jgi:hypothetical protein